MNAKSDFEKEPILDEEITLPPDQLHAKIMKEKHQEPPGIVDRPLPKDVEIEENLEEISEEEASEADVTKEDLEILPSDELNVDGGEDDMLRQRVWAVDAAGDDLDIPGEELDDAEEEIGKEDEENNHYSIGGDRHEDLEEDKELGQ